MFQWYRKAQVCHAYLSDVTESAENTLCRRDSEFSRSLWFTRGWTLQELLAPEMVIFYNKYWEEIGTKGDLRKLLSAITGIQDYYLLDNSSWISTASVAQKMCWASGRTTTRVEDEAYCLMGLFGVHMPLLYGEGKKAFYRLQLEIIASSTDESIFAWGPPISELIFNADFSGSQDNLGILAARPAMFQSCGEIPGELSPFNEGRPSYEMTNRGLRMHIAGELQSASKYLRDTADIVKESETLLFLNCGTGKSTSRKFVAIHVRPWFRSDGHGFTRGRAYKTLVPEWHYGSKNRDTVPHWIPITINNGQDLQFCNENSPNVVSIDLSSASEHGFLFRKTGSSWKPLWSDERNHEFSERDTTKIRHEYPEFDTFLHFSRSEDQFCVAISNRGQLHVNVENMSDFNECRKPKARQAPEENIRCTTLKSGKYAMARARKIRENRKSIYVVEIVIKECSAWKDSTLE
jgi:hypothetical protein